MNKQTLVALAVFAAVPLATLAQTPAAKPPVSKTEAVEVTATIEAIDHTDRVITLKNQDGEVELGVGPEIKRFDELKVGDTITFRYQESLLVEIGKPGQAKKTPASDEPAITRGKGAKPSGTISQKQKASVTIKAIDPKLSAVTVLTQDGRTVSFKVNDKKMLDGWKAGDKVDVTYTEALMVSVK